MAGRDSFGRLGKRMVSRTKTNRRELRIASLFCCVHWTKLEMVCVHHGEAGRVWTQEEAPML